MAQKEIRHILFCHRLKALALGVLFFLVIHQDLPSQSFGPQRRLHHVSKSLLPTSLDFGPDNRLYVLDLKGDIHIYSIVRRVAANQLYYDVVNTEIIHAVRDIQNHNDDGTHHNESGREATGILVLGTSEKPIIYVTSSDYRVNDFENLDKNLDTNSGTISRLTRDGDEWQKIDLIRGLPRSEENHATNGLFLDEKSNTLYVAQGGNTNAGAPYFFLGNLTEYALSAAILSIDMDAIDAMPIKTDNITGARYIYDLPTVDDPTRDNENGINNPLTKGYDGVDINDPFGGNDGLNQAKLVLHGPVQVYSSGYRNPYDIVLTDAGHMYTWDNGGNTGWGGPPLNAGYGTATNAYSSSNMGGEVSIWDGLHRIDHKGYYAGHPNAIRSNPDSAGLYTDSPSNSVFRTAYDPTNTRISLPFDWPPVDVALANPKEGIFLNPIGEDDPAIYSHRESTNGLAEYKATNFNSAMVGDLIGAGFYGNVYHIQLDGKGNVDTATIITTMGFALDVICLDDNDPFPGTIWVAAHTQNTAEPIRILEPADMQGCTGGYFQNIDEDLDGFTNADEIDNCTDPCKKESCPPCGNQRLVQGFKVSDLKASGKSLPQRND
jgi:large repetitive protein